MHDYSKICRICMSNGSRDIFHRPNIDASNPLERLLEKMRYVTMMKIEESDDLPRLICDLCIVQLNVAYNFKRQAVENDTKLRQYFIENGIASPSHHTIITNDPQLNSIPVNNNNDTSSNRSTFTPSNLSPVPPMQRPHFPIMPIIVKTEPLEIDNLSDGTVDTNLGIVSNNLIGPLTPSVTASSPGDKNGNNLNHNSCSMVYLNGYNFNTLTPSSEVESYHNANTSTLIANRNPGQSLGGSSSFASIKSSSMKNKNFSKREAKNNIINNNKTLNDDDKKSKNKSNAEITRKKIAQKRLAGQLKTRRILPETKQRSIQSHRATTPQNLRIDMAVPAGKMSRAEMKKKLFFGNPIKHVQSSSSTPQTKNSKIIKNNIVKESANIVLNPFNKKQTATDITIRKSKRTSSITKDIQRTKLKLLRPKIEPPSKN